MSEPTTDALIQTLWPQREAFRRFLISRLGHEADADDLLQHALAKALREAPTLRRKDKLIPWFYQILRNAIVDHTRQRTAALHREDAWVQASTLDQGDDERQLCACFQGLLPVLNARQAELIRRVDLQAEPVSAAARELGLSSNHASVLLHRGRAELRRRLIELCRGCACLDRCECGPAGKP